MTFPNRFWLRFKWQTTHVVVWPVLVKVAKRSVRVSDEEGKEDR
jgi:hypothetical protein